MGHTGALGFAELVEAGEVSLETSLEWHLVSNHYPPLSRKLVPFCVQAIERARDEEWEESIKIPSGGVLSDGRRSLPVWEVIEAFHLEAFL